MIRLPVMTMLRRSQWLMSALLLGLLTGPFSVTAAEREADVLETGRLLAILFDAGRIAGDNNQALINDPQKAQKGFTADVFAAEAIALFKARTGHDLTRLQEAAIPAMAVPLLERLLEESKKTISSYQTVI